MNYKGYLLDTNIIIGLFSNDQAVVDFLRRAARDKMYIYISAMTECEIFSGQKIEQGSNEIGFLDDQRYIEIDEEYLFIEKASGKDFKRPEYQLMKRMFRNGDEYELIIKQQPLLS